jgi:hypothetical protein
MNIFISLHGNTYGYTNYKGLKISNAKILEVWKEFIMESFTLKRTSETSFIITRYSQDWNSVYEFILESLWVGESLKVSMATAESIPSLDIFNTFGSNQNLWDMDPNY